MAVVTLQPGAVRWTGDDGRQLVANPGEALYTNLALIAQEVWLDGVWRRVR